MSIEVRSNFNHQFGVDQLPVLKELFQFELNQHKSVRDVVFKKVKHDRDIYQVSEIGDLPRFNVTAEAEQYSFNKPLQGAAKTVSMVKYTGGFVVTKEMINDGKFDQIAMRTRKLARAAQETKEVIAMDIFNNGFTTETALDGVAIFSTSHTFATGLSWRNKLSTDAELSPTSLAQAITDFRTQTIGDTGHKYLAKAKYLLVPDALRLYAMELVGSTLKADTAENNMNSLGNEGLIVISSPHLTSSTAWFLLADPMETGLKVIEREGYSFDHSPYEGWSSDAAYYKASYREKVACFQAQGIFGTDGVA